jgi:hypothetical protein
MLATPKVSQSSPIPPSGAKYLGSVYGYGTIDIPSGLTPADRVVVLDPGTPLVVDEPGDCYAVHLLLLNIAVPFEVVAGVIAVSMRISSIRDGMVANWVENICTVPHPAHAFSSNINDPLLCQAWLVAQAKVGMFNPGSTLTFSLEAVVAELLPGVASRVNVLCSNLFWVPF